MTVTLPDVRLLGTLTLLEVHPTSTWTLLPLSIGQPIMRERFVTETGVMFKEPKTP